MMLNVERPVQNRALKARDKIGKIAREIKQFSGAEPEIIRVNIKDFLALTECGWIQDGKLSGSNWEIKPG